MTRRVPLTVMLSRQNQAFVESCVDLGEFRSVDEFFDAALAVYRRHIHAINCYAEGQIDKGLSRTEALASVQCEMLLTRPLSTRSGRRRYRG